MLRKEQQQQKETTWHFSIMTGEEYASSWYSGVGYGLYNWKFLLDAISYARRQ